MHNSLTFLMHGVISHMDRYADNMLQAQFGLTYSRFYVLAVLGKHEPSDQHQLAVYLGYSDAAVSRMLRNLSQEELVEQSADPTHGRRRLARLSPKGRELLQKSATFLEEQFTRLMDSPEQQADLRRHMTRLQHRLHKELS